MNRKAKLHKSSNKKTIKNPLQGLAIVVKEIRNFKKKEIESENTAKRNKYGLQYFSKVAYRCFNFKHKCYQ